MKNNYNIMISYLHMNSLFTMLTHYTIYKYTRYVDIKFIVDANYLNDTYDLKAFLELRISKIAQQILIFFFFVIFRS